MLHPSYTDLMRVVNSEVEPGEQPVVNSRYSIVIATARRARQIIDGATPLVAVAYPKPLSIAVEELYRSKVKIVIDEDENNNNYGDLNPNGLNSAYKKQ
jgi:DNA-directed RNA polymerase subunit omega